MKWITTILVTTINSAVCALAIWLVAQHRPDWLVLVSVVMVFISVGQVSIGSRSAAAEARDRQDDEER